MSDNPHFALASALAAIARATERLGHARVSPTEPVYTVWADLEHAHKAALAASHAIRNVPSGIREKEVSDTVSRVLARADVSQLPVTGVVVDVMRELGIEVTS